MARPFYITTTLPYVNADPHIGFAFELVSADIIARYKKLMGHEVFFNTGTDEHGAKVYERAVKEKKDPKAYADEYAKKYRALISALGVSPDAHFIRTTDEKHLRAAQEFWRRCKAAGYISEKRRYKIKYCNGCELEKTDSELKDGKCLIHPHLALECREEENYFFRFSAFAERLKDFYAAHPDFVVPEVRFNEIKAFVERGLEDFSVSRLTAKMPWGIPVPDDDSQVIYVWFEALIDYISTLGWPDDEASFRKWWLGTGGVVQFAGKDQIRQQAAMWQAMLMAAGLPPSQQIVIHGFIQSGGQKMSKSLGNVVDPFALVNEYGTDAVRFYFARHIHPFEDSDFTLAKFKEAYNADLANGVGNLTSRIMKMAEDHVSHPVVCSEWKDEPEFADLEEYDTQKATESIWEYIGHVDALIQLEEPFKKVKEDRERGVALIIELVRKLNTVANLLLPILPHTAEQIKKLIRGNKKPTTSLFPRK